MGCKRLKFFEEPFFEVVHRKNLGKTSKKRIDYYPFGMPMPSRNLEGDYRYGYQGEYAEKEPELGSGVNSFEARLYDVKIGRWKTIDPAGSHYSPYLAMANNPIFFVDPDGREIKPKTPADKPLLDALIVKLKNTHPQLYKYLHERKDVIIYVHFDLLKSSIPNTIKKGETSVDWDPNPLPIDYSFVKVKKNIINSKKYDIVSFFSTGDKRKYAEKGLIPPLIGKQIINQPIGDNSDFTNAVNEFNSVFKINQVDIVLDKVNGNDPITLAHELGHTEFAYDNSFEYYIFNYVLNNFNDSSWIGHGKGNPDGLRATYRETNDYIFPDQKKY